MQESKSAIPKSRESDIKSRDHPSAISKKIDDYVFNLLAKLNDANEFILKKGLQDDFKNWKLKHS